MKKAIVFDVMGVVFEVGDDTNDLLVPYIQGLKPSVTREKINEIYLETSLGKITSQEFWKKNGFQNDIESLEKKYLDTCLTLDRNFIPCAEKMTDRYDLAFLSNDISEWAAYLRNKYGMDRLLKTTVISGDAGYRKPDPKIYEMLLDRLNLPANQCVFIDDRYKNLEAASRLGFNTVRFNREPMDKTFEPDAEMKSFHELKGILDKIDF